jgi:hypothetical protein
MWAYLVGSITRSSPLIRFAEERAPVLNAYNLGKKNMVICVDRVTN